MTVCNVVCGNKVELSLASIFMAELYLEEGDSRLL
jgi:hypothetical protein